MPRREDNPIRNALATIFALWFALWGTQMLVNHERLNVGGRTVWADEVARRPRQKGGGWICTYSFQAGGAQRETEESCSGSRTRIDYLPSQPSVTRVHGDRSALMGFIPLVMGYGGLIAFGLEGWFRRRAALGLR